MRRRRAVSPLGLAAVSDGSKGIVLLFQADPNFDLYPLGVRNAHVVAHAAPPG